MLQGLYTDCIKIVSIDFCMKPSIFLYYSCLLLNFILPSFLPVPVQAADATMASKYIHEDYGFALSFPRQLLLCTTPAPAPNHGFAALLRPGSCSDNTLTAQARIELYAGYEVSDATSSAALAGVICQGKAARLARLAGVKADVYQCTQKNPGQIHPRGLLPIASVRHRHCYLHQPRLIYRPPPPPGRQAVTGADVAKAGLAITCAFA